MYSHKPCYFQGAVCGDEPGYFQGDVYGDDVFIFRVIFVFVASFFLIKLFAVLVSHPDHITIYSVSQVSCHSSVIYNELTMNFFSSSKLQLLLDCGTYLDPSNPCNAFQCVCAHVCV